MAQRLSDGGVDGLVGQFDIFQDCRSVFIDRSCTENPVKTVQDVFYRGIDIQTDIGVGGGVKISACETDEERRRSRCCPTGSLFEGGGFCNKG